MNDNAAAGPSGVQPTGAGVDTGGKPPDDEKGKNDEADINDIENTANTNDNASSADNAWAKRPDLGKNVRIPIPECFPDLSNKNAVTIPATEDISTVDCCNALTRLTSPKNIVACGKINGSILIYLTQETLVPYVCTSGLDIQDQHVTVTPLVKPSTKIILSNVRPDIPNSALVRTLEYFGNIVSDIRPVSANLPGELRNVMSFRRYVFMNLNAEHADLDVHFTVVHNKRSYRIFAAVSGTICFYCKGKNHIAKNCRKRIQDEELENEHDISDNNSDRAIPADSNTDTEMENDGFQPVRGTRKDKTRKPKKNQSGDLGGDRPFHTVDTNAQGATASHHTTHTSADNAAHMHTNDTDTHTHIHGAEPHAIAAAATTSTVTHAHITQPTHEHTTTKPATRAHNTSQNKPKSKPPLSPKPKNARKTENSALLKSTNRQKKSGPAPQPHKGQVNPKDWFQLSQENDSFLDDSLPSKKRPPPAGPLGSEDEDSHTDGNEKRLRSSNNEPILDVEMTNPAGATPPTEAEASTPPSRFEPAATEHTGDEPLLENRTGVPIGPLSFDSITQDPNDTPPPPDPHPEEGQNYDTMSLCSEISNIEEKMEDFAPQCDISLTPPTHQDIAEFMRTIFNSKSAIKKCQAQYPDLRVLLRCLFSYSQTPDLDKKVKNRTIRLSKTIMQHLKTHK